MTRGVHSSLLAALFLTLGPLAAPAQESSTLDALNPEGDGWETEAISSRAEERLQLLGDWLCAPPDKRPGLTQPGAIAAASLRCTPLVMERFDLASLEDFRIRRATPAETEATGTGALAERLEQLGNLFTGGHPERFKAKTVEVTPLENGRARTRHLVMCFGKAAPGYLEHHATWEATWDRAESEAPLLVSLTAGAQEEASYQGAAPLFSEDTPAVLGALPAYTGQLRHGNDFWQSRIENHFQIHLFGQRGLAVGDADGDGLDDLYVCQPGGLPNRLLAHRPDHTAADISADAGVDFLDNSMAALFADLDNDGDQDLVVTLTSGIVFLENAGTPPRFTRRAFVPNVADGQSLCAADYDHDGDLDLYVCSYYADSAQAGELALPAPYFDANNGGANVLFRNDGSFRFTDATKESGLDENNRRWSWAAVWVDYNRDGHQDLYVANDFGRNNLYLNETGPGNSRRFRDVALSAGLRDGAFGMSAAAADYDRDGWPDLYVGNMFSSAGSRITRQPRFQSAADETRRQQFQHLARGSSLFRNLLGAEPGADPARDAFTDVSVEAGVHLGRWSWSSLFADINNDGWEDLLVANGYITGDQTGDDL